MWRSPVPPLCIEMPVTFFLWIKPRTLYMSCAYFSLTCVPSLTVTVCKYPSAHTTQILVLSLQSATLI